MARKMTEARQRLLESFDYETFRFPPKGTRDSACYSLVSDGLLESDMRMAYRDNVRGMTQFKQAYRRVGNPLEVGKPDRT